MGIRWAGIRQRLGAQVNHVEDILSTLETFEFQACNQHGMSICHPENAQILGVIHNFVASVLTIDLLLKGSYRCGGCLAESAETYALCRTTGEELRTLLQCVDLSVDDFNEADVTVRDLLQKSPVTGPVVKRMLAHQTDFRKFLRGGEDWNGAPDGDGEGGIDAVVT